MQVLFNFSVSLFLKNFFPFIRSFSPLLCICGSSPIFLFHFFLILRFPPSVSFPSISFTLQGSKWLSDGGNPTLQTQQKRWLLVLFLPLVSCVPVDALQVDVLFLLLSSPSSPQSFFGPQSFCLWWAILGRVHNSWASRPDAFSIDPSERNTTHWERTKTMLTHTHVRSCA